MVLIVTGWLVLGTSAQFWPSMKNPNESLNWLATNSLYSSEPKT